MSRGDGFAVADLDSSYMDDAKLRALWQRIQDADRMARAVVLHQSTLLASWRHGERVTVAEAAPIWLPADAELVSHLVAVRLLDKQGRVHPASWRRWFGAAEERRAKRRLAGATGGRASGNARSSNREATVEHPSTFAEPVPTVPTVPSVDTPQPPSGGGRRSNGTNPRTIAARLTADAEQRERERKDRRKTRQRAYLDGRLTEAQRDEMNDRDADLAEIPAVRGAAYSQVPA